MARGAEHPSRSTRPLRSNAGATGVDGLPVELFSSGESRWLDAQPLLPGEEEQPRILMVSVPYALQAENAQTLGGLPVSAFAKAAASTGVVNNLTSATASESVTALAGSGVLSESTPAPSSAKRSRRHGDDEYNSKIFCERDPFGFANNGSKWCG